MNSGLRYLITTVKVSQIFNRGWTNTPTLQEVEEIKKIVIQSNQLSCPNYESSGFSIFLPKSKHKSEHLT